MKSFTSSKVNAGLLLQENFVSSPTTHANTIQLYVQMAYAEESQAILRTDTFVNVAAEVCCRAITSTHV